MRSLHVHRCLQAAWTSAGFAWVAYALDLAVAWAPAGFGGR